MTEAEQFAERVEQERKRWRAYQRNRSTHDGDWSDLVADLEQMVGAEEGQ